MNSPYSFTDEMVSGAFHSITHTHTFTETEGTTTMKDVFDYKSPFGILGRLADSLFLKEYMTDLLAIRNRALRHHLEGH
jgi:ligand-binding SRPBCC domain-containing protein